MLSHSAPSLAPGVIQCKDQVKVWVGAVGFHKGPETSRQEGQLGPRCITMVCGNPELTTLAAPFPGRDLFIMSLTTVFPELIFSFVPLHS